MYYDPTTTYAAPVKINSDGTVTTFPNSTFTAAKNDGFSSSSTTTNLNTSFRAYRNGGNSSPYITVDDDDAQQAYYYNYTSGAAPSTCAANNKYTLVARVDDLRGSAELRQLVHVLPQAPGNPDGQVGDECAGVLDARRRQSTASASRC